MWTKSDDLFYGPPPLNKRGVIQYLVKLVIKIDGVSNPLITSSMPFPGSCPMGHIGNSRVLSWAHGSILCFFWELFSRL